jgi:uncharacterized protein YqjF (DUF2071 family)
MAQTWERLLFLHWPVPLAEVRPHVPAPLDVDTWEGDAWVGLTPFRLSGLRLRATPPLPALSSFLELNARTYVTSGDKPGIWFFSLDASSRLAVVSARRTYRLPYFHARMRERLEEGAIRYSSRRVGDRDARFEASYEAKESSGPAKPGSLEHFLTERYCHYAFDGGKLYRAEIHHPPWPLGAAVGEVAANTIPPPPIALEGEPLLHFADRQDVLIWSLEPSATAS